MVNGGELRSTMAHSKMVDDILHDISQQVLKPGDRLASEVQLRDKYGISITSIRRGMETLVERGILTRRRGSGTFVTERVPVIQTQSVRKETVGYYELWDYGVYHPYFSEKTRGIQAGLQQLGWKVWDISAEDFIRRQRMHSGRVYKTIEPELLLEEISRRPDLAGFIGHQTQGEALRDRFGDSLVYVNMGNNQVFPYVDYDWYAELQRLIQEVIIHNAKKIAVIGSFEDKTVRTSMELAATAVGVSPALFDLQIHSLPSGKMRNEYIHAAFTKTRELLETQGTSLEALVGTSDCEMEGILEALQTVSREKWEHLTIVGIVNKTTELKPEFPLQVLVADGYAHGLALTELLHKRLTAPHTAPWKLDLSCSWVQYTGE